MTRGLAVSTFLVILAAAAAGCGTSAGRVSTARAPAGFSAAWTSTAGGLRLTYLPVGQLPCRVWPGGAGVARWDAEVTSVAAFGPRDVWASGACVTSGGYLSIAGHWNGTSWSWVSLPQMPPGALTMIAATSDRDIWVASAGATADGGLVVDHFDGQSWTPRGFGLTGFGVDAITTSSAAEPWLIVRLAESHETPLGLYRWDGQIWQPVPYPAQIDQDNPPGQIAADPAGGVWIGGSDDAGMPLLARYTGSGWASTGLSRTSVEGGVEGLVFAGKALWAMTGWSSATQALIDVAAPDAAPLVIPGSYGYDVVAMAGDTRGRLALSVNRNGNSRIVDPEGLLRYWTGRTWLTVSPPAPPGTSSSQAYGCAQADNQTPDVNILALSSIPGGSQVWFAGFFGDPNNSLAAGCRRPTMEPVIGFAGPG